MGKRDVYLTGEPLKKVSNTRSYGQLLAALFMFSILSTGTLANPSGATVVNGSVSFDQQGNTLSITNTPGAIINWQKFSIQADETTRFIQQSASSAVLNRVTGQDPSQILGKLQSNGRVFLINPNGIVFGNNSQIDVAGLVTSSLDINDQDFLNNRLEFRDAGNAGKVINNGSITTNTGGSVYLIAPDVENHGVITTDKGEVILAAGHTVQLYDPSSPDIVVTLSSPENEAINVGQLIANGGSAGIYAGVINNSGVVSANSAVVGENGKIVFKSSGNISSTAGSLVSANGVEGGAITIQSETGTTEIAGQVSAIGHEGKGGEIKILGERVGIIEEAVVDASGKTGGGEVLIGGDYKGENPDVQNAKGTYVGLDTQIHADAYDTGDGGKVIVWSDDATRAYGEITARGGANGGDGGFVETSGGYLDVGDKINATAVNGKGGTWLLDPYDITVTSTDLNNMSSGSNPVTYTATGAGSTVAAVTINGQLDAGTSVIIDTTGAGADAGNIAVSTAITKASGGNASLTLNAHNNITINTPIASSSGTLDVTLFADQDSSGGGVVYVYQPVTTNGGFAKFIGSDVDIAASVNAGTGAVYLAPSVLGSPVSIDGAALFDLTDTDINNITTTNQVYLGYDGTTTRALAASLATAAASNITSANIYIYTTGSVTFGSNNFTTTKDLTFMDWNAGSDTFDTGLGIVSANSLHVQNYNNIAIGSGGANVTYLTLRGDDVDINGTVNATGVVIKPYPTNVAMSIGGGQFFDLTQTDITNINGAGYIYLGHNQVTSMDVATNSAVDVGARNITVYSGGTTTVGNNSFSAAGGAITISNATAAADISTGTGAISAGSVSITSVDFLTIGSGGISTTGGVTLNAPGGIMQNGNIISSGSGTISATSSAAISMNGTSSTQTNGGNVNYTAGTDITLNTISTGGTSGTVSLTATTGVITDGNGVDVNNVTANNLSVTSGGNTSLDYIITGVLDATGVGGIADLRNLGPSTSSVVTATNTLNTTTTSTTNSLVVDPGTTTIALTGTVSPLPTTTTSTTTSTTTTGTTSTTSASAASTSITTDTGTANTSTTTDTTTTQTGDGTTQTSDSTQTSTDGSSGETSGEEQVVAADGEGSGVEEIQSQSKPLPKCD